MKNPLKRGGVYSRGAFNRSITVHALQNIRRYSSINKAKIVFFSLTTVVYNYVLETCYAKVKEIENNNKQENDIIKTYLFVLTK